MMDPHTFMVFSPGPVIQLMLAPAIMISACGLLLLGTNNKYSLVVNRIRLLNQESRSIRKRKAGEALALDDDTRLGVIAHQIVRLMARLRLVRNAVLSYCLAVGLFVVTSLLLGISFLAGNMILNVIILGIFLSGMIMVFVGIVFAGRETHKGYEIVRYEVEAEQ